MHRDPTPSEVVPAAGMRIVVVEPRCLNRHWLVDWVHEAWPTAQIEAVASPAALASRDLPLDLALFGLGAATPTAPLVTAAIHDLAERIGAAPLVVLGEREDLAVVTDALRLGASGYIPTSFDPTTAMRAIEFVLAGGTFVPARSLAEAGRGAAARAARRPLDGGDLPRLTPRERDVAAAVCAGKPNKIIAHELRISEATVKVFVRQILRKLGATNRTEAASAMRRWPAGPNELWAGSIGAFDADSEPPPLGPQGNGRSKRIGTATRTA